MKDPYHSRAKGLVVYGYDLYDALQTGDVVYVCCCMTIDKKWISVGTSLVSCTRLGDRDALTASSIIFMSNSEYVVVIISINSCKIMLFILIITVYMNSLKIIDLGWWLLRYDGYFCNRQRNAFTH